MSNLVKLLRPYVGAVAVDLAALAGAGLVIYGVSLIYVPAGIILAGAMLIAGAVSAARRS